MSTDDVNDFSDYSDEELIVKFRCGFHEAFDVLLTRHRSWMQPYLLRRICCLPQVKDMMQEIWMKVIISFEKETYDEQHKFKAWLRTIAKNMVLDIWEARKKDQAHLLEMYRFGASNSKVLVRGVTPQQLMKVLKKLSAKEQQIIKLHFFKNIGFKEIARLMKMPTGTVTSVYSRALKKLRKLLVENAGALLN